MIFLDRGAERLAFDRNLLEAVLEDRRLPDELRDAFSDMLEKQITKGRLLSEKQRAWVLAKALSFGVDTRSDERPAAERFRDVPRAKGLAWTEPPPVLRDLPKRPPRSARRGDER